MGLCESLKNKEKLNFYKAALFPLTGCDPMPLEAEIGLFEEDEEPALGTERF